MTKPSLHPVALLTVTAVILVAAAAVGCTPAPFSRAPRHAQRATPAAEPSLAAPELASLTLTPVLTVATGSREPFPAFAPDSRRLAFHASVPGGHDDEHAQVHVLDLRNQQDHIVHEVEPTASTGAYYDPYAYNAYGATPVQADITHRPVFLNDQVLLVCAEALGYEYDTTASVHLVSADGERVQPFGAGGSWPRVNADGSRVLLQAIDGLSILDAQGTRQDKLPGFFGVWAPNDNRLLVHLTPYLVEGNPAGWTGGTWPGDIPVPAVNVGGLYLHDGDAPARVLTDVGGRPAWLPDGRRFVYERPVVDETTGAATLSLFLYDLDTDTERELVASARAPHVHPDGRLVVYQDPATGDLAAIELTDDAQPATPRQLGVQGRDLVISPDGRLLAVTVPHTDRRGRGRDIVVYRLDGGAAPDTPSTP